MGRVIGLLPVRDGQNYLHESLSKRCPSRAAKVSRVNPLLTLRAWDVQLYRVCDDLSGWLILPMLICSPWAFGTTQPSVIWYFNLAGYTLGVLLLLKLFIRQLKGYPAPRWENFSTRSGNLTHRLHPALRWLRQGLALLTLAVLAECLVSALNIAARYDVNTRIFTYYPHLSWLPYSLDGQRTWFHFWMYLGLACSFWAVVDWLAGMTSTEERGWLGGGAVSSEKPLPLLSTRLRILLWVLCLNGALLGLEGIFQRASGASKLLFLVQPLVNPDGLSQFGPYAYRANAAQYFNLLWPLCLGFWWTLQRAGGLPAKAHHLLLSCAAIMAACPVISSSRGGALVAVSILVLAVAYLLFTNFFSFAGHSRAGTFQWGTTGLLLLFVAVALSLAWYFGWSSLAPRLEQLGEGYENRQQMYVAAQPMLRDYPWFGTGPGTFATVFSLYRFSDEVYWPEQLHNDWLETRITFGWLGFGLVLSALGCVGLRWLVPGGLRGSRRFVVLAWLGLGGCLVHALFDFPFQIHSILLLFLVICAVLLGQSLNSGSARR